jgi:hypothetical protein
VPFHIDANDLGTGLSRPDEGERQSEDRRPKRQHVAVFYARDVPSGMASEPSRHVGVRVFEP